MNKISKNEKGFSALEAILIIVVVVLIGAVGYLVYKNHHKTATVSTTATKSSGQNNGGKGGLAGPDTGPAKTEVFIMPEWKVSASIPTPPEDAALIQYKITTANGQATAKFTTQELTDSDNNNCTADNAPAGIVVKALPTDAYYATDGTNSGQTVEQALQSGIASPYKKVGGYYYWYNHPQGLCSTASNGAQLQNDAIKQVQAIVSNLTQE